MFSFRSVVLTALSTLAVTAALSSTADADDKTKEIEKRFAAADQNQDGKLTAEEAKVLPRISSHFSRIDKDKLGYITLDQIKAMSR